MPDHAPMSDPTSLAARRPEPGPEARLEQVADRLGRLADEFPQAMGWVEAEVEALRSEVRQALKVIAERMAADRQHLATQVAHFGESLAAMSAALTALRDEVIALTAATQPKVDPAPDRRSGATGPARSGLGLPPRRSAGPYS
jgi:hypothetical protein